MKWITHIVCGICVIAALSLFIHLTVADAILGVIATILPDYVDIFFNLRHRNILTHNLLTPLPAVLLYSYPGATGFLIGYLHHLFLDSMTKQGVYIGKRRIKGTLYSRSTIDNVITIMIHYAGLMVIYKYI